MRSARMAGLLATVLSVAWAGCGGSSSTGSCSPAGTWNTSGKAANATTSLCQDIADGYNATPTDKMTITVNGATITAQSQQAGSAQYAGTLDTGTCKAILTAGANVPVPLTDGSTATLATSSTVTLTFSGSSLSGNQTINVASSTPPVQGVPCTVSATVTGTKQ